MIKEEIVQVRLNPANRKHYASFGYTGEMGEFIDVLTTHLTKSSEAKVTRVCGSCGTEKVMPRRKASPSCQRCVVIARNIEAGEPKPACKDCSKQLTNHGVTRCKPCHTVFMVGENNPNFGNGDKIRGDKNPFWKGGMPECKDCGETLKGSRSIKSPRVRCHPCHVKWCVGDNNPTYKKELHFCPECNGSMGRHSVICRSCWEDKVHNPNAVKRSNMDYKWSCEVKELASYTCDCCGSNDDMHAHHLESWMVNESLRRELSNGVCLCQGCHISFHKAYGFGENTTGQYLEFKRIYHGCN